MRAPSLLVTALAVTAAGAPLAGQPVPPGDPPSSSPARGPLLTGRDLTTLGASVVIAGVLLPADARIARWSQRSRLQRIRAVRITAATLRAFGNPGALTAGVATYGVGVAARQRGTAAVGLHTVEAVAAGSLVTVAIKSAAGRTRPYVTGDSVPTSFSFGRGIRQGNAYQSLPSGHATAAFALAGVLAAEGRERWPATNRVTGPVGYAVAALVAASRIYHDRHWASDVVLGAGIGATAGAVVARYARTHSDNRLDGRLLPHRAAPVVPVASWTVRF